LISFASATIAGDLATLLGLFPWTTAGFCLDRFSFVGAVLERTGFAPVLVEDFALPVFANVSDFEPITDEFFLVTPFLETLAATGS